jgi:hypothetical protein
VDDDYSVDVLGIVVVHEPGGDAICILVARVFVFCESGIASLRTRVHAGFGVIVVQTLHVVPCP